MANQHEVEVDDIEIGEKIGWLDKKGEQHEGIVIRLAEYTDFGPTLQVTEEGVRKPVNEDRINWREIY